MYASHAAQPPSVRSAPVKGLSIADMDLAGASPLPGGFKPTSANSSVRFVNYAEMGNTFGINFSIDKAPAGALTASVPGQVTGNYSTQNAAIMGQTLSNPKLG